MAISVKICGITTPEAADAAMAAGADYAGLVFHPASPRNLTLDKASMLAARLGGRSKTVALIADLDDARIAAIVDAVRPDFLQLHGGESVSRTADIRAHFGPVIKVLPVAAAADLVWASEFGDAADMLMFDAKPPQGAARGGGHGAAFDWNLLRGKSFARPWFLAGGLNSQNVARAIDHSGAMLVDVSSGVESAPGVKDPALIRDFIAAARQKVQA
jgi:phosphoribosylanthranilate isomerase